MDMTRATILDGSLDDELWPEIVLAMTYVKNVRPTKALGGDNPIPCTAENPPRYPTPPSVRLDSVHSPTRRGTSLKV